ncbi:hypothetical protein M3Y98_00572500 [Aphelenchoides besseyi]|nr:hypothetical protein M3Y98_00572500 [Aphelenchoides besseyi]
MPPDDLSNEGPLTASSSTLLMEQPDRVKQLETENAELRHELKIVSTKKAELEDQLIDLRAQLIERRQSEQELQNQLKTLSEFAITNGSHQKTVDLQRMYDQMVYKDGRIVELNNTIMEKERMIMDLQEMCREQGQVAQAKSLAVQIVNRRLKDIDSRKFQDASTETDSTFQNKKQLTNGTTKRENSPGRAIPQLKINGNGNGSPPPDPSEEQSSYTTETAAYPDEMEMDREWSGSPHGPSTSKLVRKHRKRVTFDLNARKSELSGELSKVKQEIDDGQNVEAQSLAQAVVDLSNENDQLRRTIAEMERALSSSEGGHKIAELEEEAEQARKEGKNQALKARAAAQARIKELEMKLFELRVSSSKEIENLKAATEVLKSSREWSLMENSRLLEQIATGKTKMEDLRGELDSSLEATTYFRQKLESEQRRNENLNIELRAANRRAQQFGEEREFLQSEIARLKEAIAAQDEFVSLLEGDLIVYEAHVGILRESLGASKKEDRQVIRSKAFAAKLNALQVENQQIAKRNNDERLRTKALNVKIRQLEQERDELLLRLSQYEGNNTHDVGESLISTDDELMNDTKPTFDEQAALMVESTVSEPILPSGNHFYEDQQLGQTTLEVQLTSAFEPLPQLSSQSTLPTVVDANSTTAESANVDQTEELERIFEQRTEAIAVLNHFMQSICEHLYAHGQSTLADQMETDLRTYQQSPDLELIVVVNQVRRFVDQVIESLVYDVSTLRVEKAAIRDQYELVRHTLAEAEDVRRNVENAQQQRSSVQSNQMVDSESQELESDETMVQLQDAREAKQRLEARIDEMDKRVLEMMVERGQFEQKIAQIQSVNSQIANEHARATAQLSDSQRQNVQLETIADQLRSEIDRLRVEAEVSRNCLEDLRNNANWRQSTSQEQAPVVLRPQPQVAAAITQSVHQTAQQVQVQPLQSQAQPPQQHIVLQPANSSAFVPVERTVDATARKTVQMNANVTMEMPLDEQQPGPSHRQSPTVDPQQLNSSVLSDVDDAAVLGEMARSSQQVAEYLRLKSARIANDSNSRPHRPHLDYESSTTASQTDHVIHQHADVQATDFYNEEQLENLETQIHQRDLDIYSLIAQRDNLLQQINDLNIRLTQSENERAQFAQQRSIESEEYSATADEFQGMIAKLQSEREALEDSLRHYMEREQQLRQYVDQLENERTELETQTIKATADEAAKITELIVERNSLTQQLNHMQLRIDELRVEHERPVQSSTPNFSLNVDFAQQFDHIVPSNEAHAQTEFEESPAIQTVSQQQQWTQPIDVEQAAQQQTAQLANMSRVVNEQKAILRSCIEESNQMEIAMNTGVESLVSLNVELENCAEAIRAQVHALSQQIARELSEQRELVARLDSNRDVSNEELTALRTELAEAKNENELNLRRISDLEEAHRTLQQTYEELTERYAALQTAFEELRLMMNAKAETAETSTETKLDGETVERMFALTATIEEMSISTATARNELQSYRERLQRLQILMATELSHTHEKLAELKTDEISALKSSVVASIGEFKTYLLHSFGQLQQALETNETADNSMPSTVLADETMRRELENTERISRALILCEQICRDIEEDSRNANEQIETSECLESMLKRIHNHWNQKQLELAENVRALQEQRHLSEVLEGRLNEAEAQLTFLQNRHVGEVSDGRTSTSSNSQTNCNRSTQPNLHLAILAARLTSKQADNDALFRCNSELAHVNVTLHSQVEQLQTTVQRVSDELQSLSSGSRHSSISALAKPAESPTESRSRHESEETANTRPLIPETPTANILVNAALERIDEQPTILTTIAIQSTSKATAKLNPEKSNRLQLRKKKKVEPKIEEPSVSTSAVDDSWAWGEDEPSTLSVIPSKPSATPSKLKPQKPVSPASHKQTVEETSTVDNAADAWAWNENEEDEKPIDDVKDDEDGNWEDW